MSCRPITSASEAPWRASRRRDAREPPPTNKKEAKARRAFIKAGPRGGEPFAERVRRVIEAEKTAEGVEDFHLSVYGHLDAGHTTANNRLAEFSGGTRTSFLHRVGQVYLEQVREGTPLAGKALTDAEIDQAAKDMLNVMREPELRSGKPVLDEEGHPKYKTGKLEPSAVYIREIATMGLDRAVADLTGKSAPSEESFNDLPITGVARRSVYEGLLYLRARFADYVAKVRSHQSKNKQGLDQPGWYAILARESRVIGRWRGAGATPGAGLRIARGMDNNRRSGRIASRLYSYIRC